MPLLTRVGDLMQQDEDVSNVTLRYLIAAIALSCCAILGIVAVTAIRPEHDNGAIIASIIAVAGGTYPGLASFIRSQANAEEFRRAKREQDRKAEEVKQALEMANKKIEATNQGTKEHLQQQDAKLDTVVRQTNGLIEKIEDKARKEGLKEGEKAALEKLGVEPRRSTDK
jgi:flagellar biosynthesis GTPase FlhF